MPMRWTSENDQLLLLKILETHDLSVDTKKVAAAWPDESKEKPTPRAISERLVKMRQLVKANGSASNDSTPSKGTPSKASKPRGKTPNSKTPTKRKAAEKEESEDPFVKAEDEEEKKPILDDPVFEFIKFDEDDVFEKPDVQETPSKRARKASTVHPGMIPYEDDEADMAMPDSSASEYFPDDVKAEDIKDEFGFFA